jgi:hypothetical protein
MNYSATPVIIVEQGGQAPCSLFSSSVHRSIFLHNQSLIILKLFQDPAAVIVNNSCPGAAMDKVIIFNTRIDP